MDIDRLGRAALLCCNHEFTNRAIMFPPATSETEEREAFKATMAAQGFSVVELERQLRQPWRYVRGAPRNRRITPNTRFTLTGPAAGSDLVKTAADRTGRRVSGTLATALAVRRRGTRSCQVKKTSTATSPTQPRSAAAAMG